MANVGMDHDVNNNENANRAVPLLNAVLSKQTDDHLYHFGIMRSQTDIPLNFGDVKFVCCGGSATRFKFFAETFAKDVHLTVSPNLSTTDRFAMYKTGPVLWVNHGMGNPSISIMLNEVIKLVHYARAKGVTFFRLGTSGGISIEPGTVVVSSAAVNAELHETHVQYVLGKKTEHPTSLDLPLRVGLCALAKQIGIHVESGKTYCADDFYEGQARLDGEFCNYTEDDKFNFLYSLLVKGVRNIEMESTCFAAMCHRANIPAAIVCVTLVNRLKTDQVVLKKEMYTEFEMRPFRLVTAYIKRSLGITH